MRLTEKEKRWLQKHERELPTMRAGAGISQTRLVEYKDDHHYSHDYDMDDLDADDMFMDQDPANQEEWNESEWEAYLEALLEEDWPMQPRDSIIEEIISTEAELGSAKKGKEVDRAWLEHRLERLKEQFRESTGTSVDLARKYPSVREEFDHARLIAAGLSLAERKAMKRHLLGEDQRTIARKLGVSQPAVSRALKGGRAKLKRPGQLSFEQFLRERYPHLL